MIFVAGTLAIAPAQIPDFRREVAAMRPKVLGEAGCRHYSLLVEDEAAGVINVLEAWDDDAALAAHLKQPWIEAFYARFSPHILSLDAKIYDIAGSREIPLG
jgi:quinol monooxygenase YgiN